MSHPCLQHLRHRFVIVIIVAALAATAVHAGTISVAWDSVSHPDLVGYRVFYGAASGDYGQWVDVGTTPVVTLSGLADCTDYHVVTKARGGDGSLSAQYSNEVVGWARPRVQSASPAAVERAGQRDITLSGANFMPGATVSFSDPAIAVNGVTVNGCNEIVANVSLSASTALGDVNVTVVNPDQVFGVGSAVLSVTNAPPDGQIDQPSGDVTIEEGDTVAFAASGSDPDGNTPLNYAWDFGDPSIPDSDRQNPGDVRFDSAGSYAVQLRVTDSLGATDATPATLTVNVNAAQAPIVSGVQAGSVGSSTATIGWTTDSPADSQVLFRPLGDTVYQQTPVDAARVTSHSVDLTGLRPATAYEYSVRSTDDAGLTTTQAASTPFSTTSSSFSFIRFEAEDGPVGAPAETQSDAASFAGAYVQLAAGSPTGTAGNPSGTWDYGFYAPSPATWYVWMRMFAPSNGNSTWYERVDGAGFSVVAPAVNGSWTWVAGRSYGLGSGPHVLTLGGGDALARVDRVLITDDPGFTPSEGPGGDNSAPTAVAGLAAQPDDAAVSLSWTNPTDPDPLRVVVRFSPDGSFPQHPQDGLPLIDRSATRGAADGVLHTGLTNGTTYSYSVFAIDPWGNASTRATISAMPQPPAQPLGQVQNLRRTDTLSN